MKLEKTEVRSSGRKTFIDVSFKVSAYYLIFGAAWILVSDIVMAMLSDGLEVVSFIGIAKGLFFVLVSSLVIYHLVHRSVQKIQQKENKLAENQIKIINANNALSEAKELNTVIVEKMINAFALHRIILDDAGNPIDYEFLDVNPAFEEFTGIEKEQIVGRTYRQLLPRWEEEKVDWVKIYGEVALTGQPKRFVDHTAHFDKWVAVNAYSPKKDFFITVFNDITPLKRTEEDLRRKNEEITELYDMLVTSEEELRQQYDELIVTQEELKKQYLELEEYQNKLHYSAYHDLVTGLPNRLSLVERMAKHIDQFPGSPVALLFVDLDNFKLINDTMGHSFGDQLIIDIGRKVSSLMGEGQSVYRFGGDEFIVCCFGFKELSEITSCAEEIIQCFKSPVVIGDSMLHITVSIGISVFPEDGYNTDELLQCADIAMYKAKQSGKNRYVLFNTDMKESVNERMSIEKHLRDALKNQELQLYYQPLIDIGCRKICGFEALLRWFSPTLGFISPLKFIGVAEETRLIIPIGEWVLYEACRFLKSMQQSGDEELTIAVNISILQLFQDNFVELVLKVLRETGLNPACLELEITESVLMESYQTVTQKLCQLREAGVRIALDDFGQGYSSLSYLQKLPIHTLKIDKSFIDGVASEESEKNLTDTIIVIGKKMGLTILAEGVEKECQLEYLQKHQCHKVQGYYFSKPLPRHEAAVYWQKHHTGL